MCVGVGVVVGVCVAGCTTSRQSASLQARPTAGLCAAALRRVVEVVSVRLTYARGRPLGLPHIPEPTEAEIDHWHAVYCERVKELFERYKGFNPDYKHKELLVE